MGILDNDYATLMAAPDTFRLAAERKLADAQAALDTAQQTAQLQAVDAQKKIADLQAETVAGNATIAQLKSDFATTQAQFSAAKSQLSAVLPSLQFVEGYESDVVQPPLPLPTTAVPLPVAKHEGWYPVISPAVGGQRPSYHMAQIVSGKLYLGVTGVPGKWCDVLWADKRPPLPDGINDFALDFGFIPVYAGDPLSVQCLEFDTLCIQDGYEYNLSSQYVRSSGKIQIANGTTKGGWIDSGITLANFDLAAHHTIRWVYKIDRPNKSCQYVSLIVDGVRHDVDPKIGVQPAYPQNWGNQLALQLQQDVSSVGGSYTTVFDSIKYVYRSA